MIADFATVGVLASIDIIVRQDVDDGSTGTLILLAGLFGGGGAGYLLTQKYEVDAGAAHATTLGLLVGAANGALLVQPLLAPEYDAEDVMTLLFVGSALGTAGGFAYGQTAKLTEGQSIFLGNAMLLGSATAALGAITGSRDGEFGNWETGALAVGLDAGVLAGALLAPRLDWSRRRARIILAGTTVGALVGGLVAGLTTNKQDDEDYNGHLLAGSMTAGLWAGFALGVVMTRDSAPDARYDRSVAPAAPPAPPTSVIPFVGERQVGLLAGGTW
ncbi:MAG: hypothetical protein H0X17_12050 [Deltaproteobacteria bacterium]|nr:hypothetical protein [Deltaproteobacteria bacterium]